MSVLLDTNVVSEWVKPVPDPNVVAWLASVEEDDVYLSVATVAEIRRGIALLPAGRRRDRLTAWLTADLPARFEGRVLDVDHRVADAWGTITVLSERAGKALGTMDAFVAATAQVHGLTFVTRNVRHFRHTGIRLLDPWTATA